MQNELIFVHIAVLMVIWVPSSNENVTGLCFMPGHKFVNYLVAYT